jgi:hypothetical protein
MVKFGKHIRQLFRFVCTNARIHAIVTPQPEAKPPATVSITNEANK